MRKYTAELPAPASPDQTGRAGWPERGNFLRGLSEPDGREVTTTRWQLTTGKVFRFYETMPGWSESTFGVKDRSGSAAGGTSAIKRIEELTGVPIDIISTGPDRTETMILRDPFDA